MKLTRNYVSVSISHERDSEGRPTGYVLVRIVS